VISGRDITDVSVSASDMGSQRKVQIRQIEFIHENIESFDEILKEVLEEINH
jgi:hypothetical protein